jgi:hypothetical protein
LCYSVSHGPSAHYSDSLYFHIKSPFYEQTIKVGSFKTLFIGSNILIKTAKVCCFQSESV